MSSIDPHHYAEGGSLCLLCGLGRQAAIHGGWASQDEIELSFRQAGEQRFPVEQPAPHTFQLDEDSDDGTCVVCDGLPEHDWHTASIGFELDVEIIEHDRHRGSADVGAGAPAIPVPGVGGAAMRAAVEAEQAAREATQREAVAQHRSVADILERVAILDAITDLANERRKTLRDELQAECDRVADETGAVPNFPVRNIGRVYITNPAEVAGVRDQATFLRWAEIHQPALVHVRQTINLLAIERILNENPVLRAQLETRGAFTLEKLIDDDGIADILDQLVRSRDGSLFDQAGTYTGLAYTARSKPALTVKIDAAAKRRWQAVISSEWDPSILRRALSEPLALDAPAAAAERDQFAAGIDDREEAARADQTPGSDA